MKNYKAYLEELALTEEPLWIDDRSNLDDAYDGGYRDGQIVLAREILEYVKGLS
jgi:hypothetical protein